MDLYHNKDGSRKSTEFMSGFFLSLIFLAVYFGCYVLLTEWFFDHLAIPGHILASNILCTVLVAVAGTAICSLSFLLPSTGAGKAAYRYLALYFLICIAAVWLSMAEEDRSMMLEVVCLYGLAPVLIGNLSAELICRRLPKRRKTSGEQPIP